MRPRSQYLAAFVLVAGASSAFAQTASPAGGADDDVEIPSAPPSAKPPAEAAAPAPAPARPADEALVARQAETDARVAALAARLDAELAARAAPPAPLPARPVAEVTAEVDAKGDGGDAGVVVLPRPGFLFSGYAQGQYFASRASHDQLQQGGGLLNLDQFAVRRARLRADRRWRYAALTIEIDGNTTAGSAFGLRRAEASLLWDGPRGEGAGTPLVLLTAGMFYIPFGYELPAAARTRPFMERSLSSTALFPGQADVGVRLAGAWRFLRYAVAVVNGEPVTESASRPFRGDPNAAKDVVGRLGVDVTAAPALRIAGGVSLLQGKGFHSGTDATKSGTVWVDANEDGRIDAGEVTPLPATAATPSANFRHWAVGADLRFALRTPLGLTHLAGEVILASNLDRGLFGADPIASGLDVRQLGFYAAIVQDLFAWGLVGFRLDLYNPRLDAFDSRAGQLLPNSQTITTLSPLVGVRFGDRARLSLEYDHIIDNLARDGVGVPTDLGNDQLTARLQVDL